MRASVPEKSDRQTRGTRQTLKAFPESKARPYRSDNSHPANNNFADYMVAVNADVPDIECIFLDYPDTVMNEYGARGIGEIGLTGCASALTSATYYATGVRVRELPIRIENLMAPPEQKT